MYNFVGCGLDTQICPRFSVRGWCISENGCQFLVHLRSYVPILSNARWSLALCVMCIKQWQGIRPLKSSASPWSLCPAIVWYTRHTVPLTSVHYWNLYFSWRKWAKNWHLVSEMISKLRKTWGACLGHPNHIQQKWGALFSYPLCKFEKSQFQTFWVIQRCTPPKVFFNT